MQLADPRYDAFPGIVAPGIAYDTIWTLALGLQRAAETVAQKNESGCEGLVGDLVPLEEFDYKNQKMGCIFRRSLAETKFTGITVSDMTACNVYKCISLSGFHTGLYISHTIICKP